MVLRRAPLETAQRLEKKGDVAGAAEAYAEHLGSAPTDMRVLLRVAELRERLGDSVKAAAYFRELGELHIKEGYISKGIAALRQAMRLAPTVDVALRLAQLFRDESKRGDAAAVLRSLDRLLSSDAIEVSVKLKVLELRAEVEPGPSSTRALVDALVDAGRAKEAISRLRKLATEMGDQVRPDRLDLYEQISALVPEDRDAALTAARSAIELTQGRRALVVMRPTLDFYPEDPDLIAACAQGLQLMGENARALMVYREAAKGFTLKNSTAEAREQWASVLKLDPNDEEARAVAVPAAAAAAAKEEEPPAAAREAQAFSPISKEKLNGALAILDRTPHPVVAPVVPNEFTLDIQPSELTVPLLLTEDPARSAAEAGGAFDVPIEVEADSRGRLETTMNLGAPALNPEAQGPVPWLEEEEEAGRFGPRTPPVPSAPLFQPKLEEAQSKLKATHALVMLEGAEGGWLSRASADLGLKTTVVTRSEEGAALEKAKSSGCDLILAPAGLLDLWRHLGSWQAAGAWALPRAEARARVKAASLPAIEGTPARTLGELQEAVTLWGPALELVGDLSADTVQLTHADSALFCLGLALSRLGGSLLVEPASGERVRVLVAGTRQGAMGIAAWKETLVGRFRALESPIEAEADLLREGVAAARALKLRGAGVLLFAKPKDTWLFDGMEAQWGPGGLLAEARTGLTLLSVAMDALSGTLPQSVEHRGTAFALATDQSKLTSPANLRVEPALEGGQVYACAHSLDREQALRRIQRSLGVS